MSPRKGLDPDTILQVAATIADEKGIGGLTLAEIAHRLDIKTPSLYNHVESLGAVVEALAISGLELLRERIQERVLSANEGRGDIFAIPAAGLAYVEFARQHPGLYEATLKAPESSRVQVSAQALLETVEALFMFQGLSETAKIHAIRGFRSLLHGFVSLEKVGGFGIPLSTDETLRVLLDAFVAGVRTMEEQAFNEKS